MSVLTEHPPVEVAASTLGEGAVLEGLAARPELGWSLVERTSLTCHRLATLFKNALLATEELEALRDAYRKKKAAPARG